MADNKELLKHLFELTDYYNESPIRCIDRNYPLADGGVYSAEYNRHLDIIENAKKNLTKRQFDDLRLDVDSDTMGNDNITNIWEHLPDSFKFFFERVTSHVHSSGDYSNAKILIVGTITPSGGKDFFYTAPRTNMYKIIDKILGTGFDKLKNNRKELETKLEEKGIFFLDVFDEVIRKRNSSSDNDILFASLNYRGFDSHLSQLSNDTIVVANSKLAYSLCVKIIKRLYCNGGPLKKLLPESHTIFRKSLDEMVKDWTPIFEKAKLKKN